MAPPEVSVVVPTRDRPEPLARCLAALTRQSIYPVIEIVVVDDGSTAREAVARVVGEAPGARLIRQIGGGVASARNTGVEAASAPLICLIDDDCDPVVDWAETFRSALLDGADAVAGPTVSDSPADVFGHATQTIVNYVAAQSWTSRSSIPFAPGSNLAFTAETARALPFDEGYGPGGEDRDWCARLVRSGRGLVWEPRAIVRHHQELTLAGFLVKHANWGRGAHRFRRTHPNVPLLETPGFYADLVATGFQQGLATGALVCLAQLATAAGYVEGVVSTLCRPGSETLNGSARRNAGG